MRNPFRERNLMSVKDNPFMRAYRENPKKVREILETAYHTSWPTRNEVKEWIKLMAPEKGKEHDKRVSVSLHSVAGLGVGMVFCFFPIAIHDLFISGSGQNHLLALEGWLFSGLVGTASGYYSWRRGNRRINEYSSCKNDADRNLGYQRVKDTNQLEFLFD